MCCRDDFETVARKQIEYLKEAVRDAVKEATEEALNSVDYGGMPFDDWFREIKRAGELFDNGYEAGKHDALVEAAQREAKK